MTTALHFALSAIFTLESAIAQAGKGATKKQIILDGVQALLKNVSLEAGSTAGAIAAAVSTFIDSTVAALNKDKVFQKVG